MIAKATKLQLYKMPVLEPNMEVKEEKKKKKRVRIRGRRRKDGKSSDSKSVVPRKSRLRSHQIPDEILHDTELNEAIKILPSNYEFEIHKTVWRLRKANSKLCALQFPEGLLMYACIISDILERFAGVETLVMGDVTYGACCVDDYSARSLGADFMVHYGHSCLVPIDVSRINMLYVFVDIKINMQHFVDSVKHNFKATDKLALAGTIQFATSIQAAKAALSADFPVLDIPQGKPLSRGEVLGCTSPKLGDYDALIFIADGRFHLESIMIQNPNIRAFYKYDPYNRKLTVEKYDHAAMHKIRQDAIDTASKAKKFGLILGTLGRQGNPHVLKRLESLLKERKIPFVVVLLSEIFPAKLAMFEDIDAWVQVACPRLSIDWGYAFDVPLLNSYEAEVALKSSPWLEVYPMDYYRQEGGEWTNYSHRRRLNDSKKKQAPISAAAAGSVASVQTNTQPVHKSSKAKIKIELEIEAE